jgi:hypothetical protein
MCGLPAWVPAAADEEPIDGGGGLELLVVLGGNSAVFMVAEDVSEIEG